jgi:carbon storage regulator
MLVLSRKQGESILLPRQDVSVTILGVSRNRVRIGITAPRDVTVYRGEIWNRAEEPVALPSATESDHPAECV